MRLINVNSHRITEFISDERAPRYAILSHTWDVEEVSFQDWHAKPVSELREMKGYQKIDYCCKQASEDAIEWVWVDTCCIDKTSSAELSEAINSMFRWYKNAQVCYVYLSDVRVVRAVPQSRWFTRGWTLQELIAPKNIEFYSSTWEVLGSKVELREVINDVTDIPLEILDGGDLQNVCIAQRMSWAADRNTSRSEDAAYCLLGIFDINIPLIYGEGEKAFQRLQEELMKITRDPSLFAWGPSFYCDPKTPRPVDGDKQISTRQWVSDHTENKLVGSISLGDCYSFDEMPWQPSAARHPTFGLLAKSPTWFKNSRGYTTLNYYLQSFLPYQPAPTFLRDGCLVNLPICDVELNYRHFYGARSRSHDGLELTQLRKWKIAILLCTETKPDLPPLILAIPLQAWGAGKNTYARSWELLALRGQDLPLPGGLSLQNLEAYSTLIHIGREPPNLLDSDFKFSGIFFRRLVSPQEPELVVLTPDKSPLWFHGDRIAAFFPSPDPITIAFLFRLGPWEGAQVVIGFTWGGQSDEQLRIGTFTGPYGWIKERLYSNELRALVERDASARRMEIPEDTHVLRINGLPEVHIHSTRRYPEAGGGRLSRQVDVVDLVVVMEPSLCP